VTISQNSGPRFRVGDHVRVVGPDRGYEGRVGIVANTYEYSREDSAKIIYRYVVSFLQEGRDAVFFDSDLELVSELLKDPNSSDAQS
jgi:hypothetical protein